MDFAKQFESQSDSVLEYDIENQPVILFIKKAPLKVWNIFLEFNRKTQAI